MDITGPEGDLPRVPDGLERLGCAGTLFKLVALLTLGFAIGAGFWAGLARLMS